MSLLSHWCAKTRSVVLKATFCGVMTWGLGALPASAYDGPVEAKVFKADSLHLPTEINYRCNWATKPTAHSTPPKTTPF